MLEVLLFEGGKEELKEKGVEVLTFTGFYGTLFEEDNHAAYTDPAYVVAVVRRSQRVYMARWDYSEGETWVEVDLNPGTAVQVLPPRCRADNEGGKQGGQKADYLRGV